MAYFEKSIETATASHLRQVQTQRLKDILSYAERRVPFYRTLFGKHRFSAGRVSSLDDLKYAPFTTKACLRDAYPFGMFAVPLSDIVEIHASSGTTGKLIVVGYTRADVKLWATVMARTLVCAGVGRDDIIHNCYGYGLFTGGLGFHYGGMEIGATVVPLSSGQTQRQVTLIADFKPTVLTCTPSYSLHMADEARSMGMEPAASSLRVGIFGAEPWSEGMRGQIEREWGLTALDVYGLSEIIGPGVAQECPGKDGLHVWADHFLPEVIDPKTGEAVEEGAEGELVLTTLTKEALPMIRYRTGDIVAMTTAPCPHCGRTMPRISKIKGRIDDMLIIRGVNVFPSQIETVLMGIPEVAPHYQLVVTRENYLDKLEVRVEVSPRLKADEVKSLEELEQKVLRAISGTLGLSVTVTLVQPKSIERSLGKAKRVIDRRSL